MRPVSGRKHGRGVLRGDPALQRRAARADAVLGEAQLGERRPAARSSSWERTRSMSVISSDTVCSTWMRGFISMNTCSPEAGSTRNSTVPAFT